MKEDVLEQVVEDYLQLRGYFTMHNLRFKPDKAHPNFVTNQDSVPSDVDVVGFNPLIIGPDRVRVVSCKSWQAGFNPAAKLSELQENKKRGKSETWHHFRELWKPKWSEAFHHAVQDLTGESVFTYSLAVAKLIGKQTQSEGEAAWAADPTIAQHLKGCDFTFLTMREMWSELQDKLKKTPAPSEIGRLAQLLKAAGIEA
jgi:hypothetical protein